MDITGWLQGLEVGRTPAAAEEHVRKEQTRRAQSLDSSILQLEKDSRKHRKRRHRHRRGSASPTPCGSVCETHLERALKSNQSMVQTEVSPSASATPSKDVYKRRSRHKTRHDRYNPKVRTAQPENSASRAKPTKPRRRKHKDTLGPNAEAASLQHVKPVNVASDRLTVSV